MRYRGRQEGEVGVPECSCGQQIEFEGNGWQKPEKEEVGDDEEGETFK